MFSKWSCLCLCYCLCLCHRLLVGFYNCARVVGWAPGKSVAFVSCLLCHACLCLLCPPMPRLCQPYVHVPLCHCLYARVLSGELLLLSYATLVSTIRTWGLLQHPRPPGKILCSSDMYLYLAVLQPLSSATLVSSIVWTLYTTCAHLLIHTHNTPW